MHNSIQNHPINTDAIPTDATDRTQEQTQQTWATTTLSQKLHLSPTVTGLNQLEAEKITKRNISLDTPITELANNLEKELTSLKKDVQKFKTLDRAESIQNNALGYFEKKIDKIKKIIDWFSCILLFKTIIHPTEKNYPKDLKNIEGTIGTIKGKIEDKKKDLNSLKDINRTTLNTIKKSINYLEEVKKWCDELKINQNKNIEAKKDDFEVFKANVISTITLVKIAIDITNNQTDDFTNIRTALAQELKAKEENIPQHKDELVKLINNTLTSKGEYFQKNL